MIEFVKCLLEKCFGSSKTAYNAEEVVGLLQIPNNDTIDHGINSERSIKVDDAMLKFRLQYSPNQLKVTVVRATNLPAMDHDGKSDPYVKVRLKNCSNPMEKVTNVKSDSLNPTFCETFSFNLTPDDLKNPDAELNFTVMDRDTCSEDDFIGALKLPLEVLKLEETANKTYNLALVGHKNGVADHKKWAKTALQTSELHGKIEDLEKRLEDTREERDNVQDKLDQEMRKQIKKEEEIEEKLGDSNLMDKIERLTQTLTEKDKYIKKLKEDNQKLMEKIPAADRVDQRVLYYHLSFITPED